MKFLHLSDLHIGKIVNGFSMLEEQKHAFLQIVEYIKTQSPDAIVIAGDVYDRAVPNVEAVRAFDDFLTTLSKLNIAVMLIAGNHDSPERLNYASRLLADKGIYLCGIYDGELKKVMLSDKHGEVNFWLLPFIRPATVRAFADSEIETYGETLSAVLNNTNIDYGERNVLISHQFYTSVGVAPIRSESEINAIGGLDAIDTGYITNFDYVALGHLHRAQQIGKDNIRYAGSPIKYSFSEWKYEKSITLVELNEKGSVDIKSLPLNPLHDMREIRGKLEDVISEKFILQGNAQDYLRIILTDDDEIIDPMGKLRSVYPNIMALDFDNARTSIDVSQIMTDSENVQTLSTFELFSEFFLEMSGAVMSEEQSKIISELLDSEVRI